MNEEPQATVGMQPSKWRQVTPFSKYLAMTLFIALPFIGGWVGYTLVPERTVVIDKIRIEEKEVRVEVPVDKIVVIDIDSRTTYRNEQLGIEFAYPTAYGSTSEEREKGECPVDYMADPCDQIRVNVLDKTYQGGAEIMLVTEAEGRKIHGGPGRDGYWGDQAANIQEDYLEVCRKDQYCKVVVSDYGVSFAKYTDSYGPSMGMPSFDIEYRTYKEGEPYSGFVLAPISSEYYENPAKLFEDTVIKSFKFLD